MLQYIILYYICYNIYSFLPCYVAGWLLLVHCVRYNISLQIDRGSMEMAQHQLIYSLERKFKKQWSHNEYNESLLLDRSVNNSNNLLILLAADPPSSHPEWALLYLFSCFPHLCWVPTDSFPQRGGEAPHPLFLQIGSRIWIRATAHCSVGHTYNFLIYLNFYFLIFLLFCNCTILVILAT